jgi:hypothetical protein
MRKTSLWKIKKHWNKNVNVIIGKGLLKDDLSLFMKNPPKEQILRYPKNTKIGKILIDTGIAKSWSQINGSCWKNYKIPIGFTDLYLNRLSIWNGEFWGERPHRLTILKLQ